MSKRVDRNQTTIVKIFRQLGCRVLILSEVGKGCPDLLISVPSSKKTALIEVKDGEKPPSQRKLTPAESSFHESWLGDLYVISSVQEAIDLVTKLRGDNES